MIERLPRRRVLVVADLLVENSFISSEEVSVVCVTYQKWNKPDMKTVFYYVYSMIVSGLSILDGWFRSNKLIKSDILFVSK